MAKSTQTMPSEKKAGRPERKAFPALGLPRSVFFRAKVATSGPLPSPQPSQADMAKQLRQFELFAQLPPAVLELAAAGAQRRAYRQGEFVWQRGDAARQVVLIESGFIKASRRDRKGASKTFGLFGPGDSMGLYAFWADMRYPTDAVALNEGLVLVILDAVELTRLAAEHAQLAENLKGEVTRFSEAFIKKIEIISAGTIPQRLAVLMMQLVSRYGVERKGERARLPVSLTLEQIAEIIGARIETVARALGQWKRAGWLITNAQGCHFERLDKLRELLPD